MAREQTNQNDDGKKQNRPIVIKKYANRRLYNTATSSYVTLDHLCQMVKDEVDFTVYDAKTGEDITRSVLTQIIVEEESKGTNLLPIAFLRQLISFYGHSMQGMVPRYLEQMMAAFAANQDALRQQMQDTMSGMFPFGGNLEEMSRQNAALMQNAMKMFAPFGAQAPAEGECKESPSADAQEASTAESMAQLKAQVDRLQQQLDQLSEQQGAGARTENDGDAESAGSEGQQPSQGRGKTSSS